MTISNFATVHRCHESDSAASRPPPVGEDERAFRAAPCAIASLRMRSRGWVRCSSCGEPVQVPHHQHVARPWVVAL